MGRKISMAVATGGVLVVLGVAVAALALHADPIVSQRTVGNLTMQAAPPSARAGETIRLSLIVTGPAQYNSCRPVRFWADDARGNRAWTEVQFWACMSNAHTEAVPDGKKITFAVDWRTAGMAAGRYTVRGAFGVVEPPAAGNVPVVTVEIKPSLD